MYLELSLRICFSQEINKKNCPLLHLNPLLFSETKATQSLHSSHLSPYIHIQGTELQIIINYCLEKKKATLLENYSVGLFTEKD